MKRERCTSCELCDARALSTALADLGWHMVRDADGRERWACGECVVGVAMELELPAVSVRA